MQRPVVTPALKAAGKLATGHFFGPLFLILNLLLCAPVLYACVWCVKQLDRTPHFGAFAWFFRGLALGILGAAFFATVAMSRHFVDEAQPVFYSLKAAWVDVFRNLQWLPLIGHWFERKRDPREALEDDEPGERPPQVE